MKYDIIYQLLNNILNSFLSLIRIIILSRNNSLLKDEAVNDCVILGNGPSLKQTLKESIEFIVSTNRTVFSVNTFCFSEYFERIKPSYYIISAPEFYIEKTTEFHKQLRSDVFNDLISRTTWPMILFLPTAAKKSSIIINRFDRNKNIKVTFFNTTPVEGFQSFNNFLFKHNLGMPRPHNVLIPSIFLALNLEFKSIYIFGADHSWHEEIIVDENNRVSVNHQHFYEKEPIIMPMYKLDGKEYYIHDVFRKLHLAFKGYFVLKSYSDYLGAKIFNASVKSYIDAFQKIKL